MGNVCFPDIKSLLLIMQEFADSCFNAESIPSSCGTLFYLIAHHLICLPTNQMLIVCLHTSSAVLSDNPQVRLITDVRITNTVLLRQIMQLKYNQPQPLGQNYHLQRLITNHKGCKLTKSNDIVGWNDDGVLMAITQAIPDGTSEEE